MSVLAKKEVRHEVPLTRVGRRVASAAVAKKWPWPRRKVMTGAPWKQAVCSILAAATPAARRPSAGAVPGR